MELNEVTHWSHLLEVGRVKALVRAAREQKGIDQKRSVPEAGGSPAAKNVAIEPAMHSSGGGGGAVGGSRVRRRSFSSQAPLRDLPATSWPSSAAVDALEARAAKLRREGVPHPRASPDLKTRGEGWLRAAAAAYDAAECKPAKAAMPRQGPPTGNGRGGRGGQASDRRADWRVGVAGMRWPSAIAPRAGHRAGGASCPSSERCSARRECRGGRCEPPDRGDSVHGEARDIFAPIWNEASLAGATEAVPKLEFTRRALGSAHAQPASPVAGHEIRDIFARSAAPSPCGVARAREGWIYEIERLGRSFEDSGDAAAERRSQAPQQFEPIVREVNIPLLRALVARSKYGDTVRPVDDGIRAGIAEATLPGEELVVDGVREWAGAIARALESGMPEPRAASKLAWALSWASQSLFERLGSAVSMSTFGHLLSNAALAICLDNRGAEQAVARGAVEAVVDYAVSYANQLAAPSEGPRRALDGAAAMGAPECRRFAARDLQIASALFRVSGAFANYCGHWAHGIRAVVGVDGAISQTCSPRGVGRPRPAGGAMRGVGYGSPASPWSSAYLDSPMSRGSDRADMPVNSRVRVKLGLDFQHFREGDCGTVTSVKADSIREVLFDDQAVPLPVARRHLELLEGRSPVASGRVSPKPRPPQPAPGAAMPLPGRPRSPLQPRSPLGGAPSPASGAGAYGADSPVGRWPLSPERQPTSGFGTYAADSPLRHRPLSPGPTGGPGARAADSPARLRPLSPAGTHGAETPVRQRPFSPDSHTRYPIDVTTNSVLRGESGRSPSPSHLSGSLGRRAVSSTTSPTMASSEAASLLASLREERRAREALELQVKKLVENNGHYNQILASKEADALKENDTLRRSVEELRRQLAQEREERRLLRDDKQDVGGPGTQALSPRLGGASYGYGGKPCVGTPLGGSFGTQGLRSAEQAVYVADNSCLHAKTPGIHYRLSTTLNSLDDPGNLLRWGSKVSGIECMGGEWLKVEGHGYLPMRLDGVQVLKRKARTGDKGLFVAAFLLRGCLRDGIGPVAEPECTDGWRHRGPGEPAGPAESEGCHLHRGRDGPAPRRPRVRVLLQVQDQRSEGRRRRDGPEARAEPGVGVRPRAGLRRDRGAQARLRAVQLADRRRARERQLPREGHDVGGHSVARCFGDLRGRPAAQPLLLRRRLPEGEAVRSEASARQGAPADGEGGHVRGVGCQRRWEDQPAGVSQRVPGGEGQVLEGREPRLALRLTAAPRAGELRRAPRQTGQCQGGPPPVPCSFWGHLWAAGGTGAAGSGATWQQVPKAAGRQPNRRQFDGRAVPWGPAASEASRSANVSGVSYLAGGGGCNAASASRAMPSFTGVRWAVATGQVANKQFATRVFWGSGLKPAPSTSRAFARFV
ncbi:unnamed protein product [Prorocentrum cordatum]|uniref:Uncharacterized protein n=1 Tax=Prorocentrum cordatum TaxID=2364126 RepID=A0ABN9XI48_9DINO|nr:unnamed protein product [Polarella glacialis]